MLTEPSFESSRHLLNQLFSFETDKYPFQKLFLDQLNRFQTACNKPPLQTIGELFTGSVSFAELNACYLTLYEFEESQEFLKVYRTFTEEVVFPLFSNRVLIQKKPGIRIQPPQNRTVQYHTDYWYGHGPNVFNFWLPLVDVSQSNSLQLANLEASIKAVNDLLRGKPTLAEINDKFKEICHPVNCRYGQFTVFHSQSAHGTEPNQTATTRMSLDFRILFPGESAGLKNIEQYYTDFRNDPLLPKKGIRRRGLSYIDVRYGLNRSVGTVYQRLINQEYARHHQIDLLEEEVDIQPMAHHPSLLSMSEGKATYDIETVVLFSVHCLPESQEDRRKIYESARRHGIELHFALEQYSFPMDVGETTLEERRQSFLALASTTASIGGENHCGRSESTQTEKADRPRNTIAPSHLKAETTLAESKCDVNVSPLEVGRALKRSKTV